MTLKQFLTKQSEVAREKGIRTAFTFAKREVQQKLDTEFYPKPNGIADQGKLLSNALDTDEKTWIFWFDGGRADYFEQIYPQYVTGELTQAWNGAIGYSGDWAKRHLERDMTGYGLFSTSPVRSLLQSDYDGRDWFSVAPKIETDVPVAEQLAALGYREQKANSTVEIEPGATNESVRKHKHSLDGGIIRYLKPHPPFAGLEKLTSGTQKTRNTWYALWGGELSESELATAYRETYNQAFEAAVDLIPELEGDVYITADHGECLAYCGQLYHGRQHDMHDHLCAVPWFKVDGLAED